MKETFYSTLERQLSAVDFSARDRANVLRRMRGEQRPVRRKLSFGLAVALALTLLSVTAVAVGIAVNALYGRVIQMEAQQQTLRWALEDKLAFVSAMREAGLEMEESDWAILSDASREEAARGDAADRIIYARYGALQEEQNENFVQPRESVYGEPPDIEVVFRERYLAEHPDASEQDYMDAWGYFMRDEYGTIYEAMMPREEEAQAEPDRLTLTEERAVAYVLGQITEVYTWGKRARDNALCTARLDARTGIWLVTAVVAQADMVDAFDPILEGYGVERTQTGYRLTMAVGMDGSGFCWSGPTVEACEGKIAGADREAALYTVYIDEAREIAKRAVQEKYGLTDEEINAYFIREADLYLDDPTCIREGLYFNAHNTYASEWDYAVIVNFTTAQVDDIFTPQDLWERLPRLGEAYFKLDHEGFLNYMRWYTTWNPVGRFSEWPEQAQSIASEALKEAREAERAAAEPGAYLLLDEFTLEP